MMLGSSVRDVLVRQAEQSECEAQQQRFLLECFDAVAKATDASFALESQLASAVDNVEKNAAAAAKQIVSTLDILRRVLDQRQSLLLTQLEEEKAAKLASLAQERHTCLSARRNMDAAALRVQQTASDISGASESERALLMTEMIRLKAGLQEINVLVETRTDYNINMGISEVGKWFYREFVFTLGIALLCCFQVQDAIRRLSFNRDKVESIEKRMPGCAYNSLLPIMFSQHDASAAAADIARDWTLSSDQLPVKLTDESPTKPPMTNRSADSSVGGHDMTGVPGGLGELGDFWTVEKLMSLPPQSGNTRLNLLDTKNQDKKIAEIRQLGITPIYSSTFSGKPRAKFEIPGAPAGIDVESRNGIVEALWDPVPLATSYLVEMNQKGKSKVYNLYASCMSPIRSLTFRDILMFDSLVRCTLVQGCHLE